jgi:hypothetical protein
MKTYSVTKRPITVKRNDSIDFSFTDLDNDEYSNYRNTFVLMLNDRWQHCRQMGNTARDIFNLSSITNGNNQTFINEFSTLLSNTAYQASIIKQNMVN